jgi:hypothetical protein
MSIRRVAAALLAASLVAGCGLMAARQEQREARVVGDRLTAAGFRRVPADTPVKQEHLGRMPKLLFTSATTRHRERRYLLADPDRCRCLYVGDEAAYQRYTNLELAKEEKTSAAAAKRDDRNAGVNDLPPEIDAFAVDIELDTKGAN